jgi:membrane protease YdiL (CAAX protease family)
MPRLFHASFVALLATLLPLAAGMVAAAVFSTHLGSRCISASKHPCSEWSIGLTGWAHLGSQVVAATLIALAAITGIRLLKLAPLSPVARRAPGVIAGCLAASFLIEILNLWAGGSLVTPHFEQASVALSISTFGMMVLLAPVAEELFFRGFVQRQAMRHVGVVTSMLVASLPFALLHGSGSPTQTILLFLLSLLWGWAYWRTGLLWVPMLAHGLNNGLSLAIAGILS